MSERITVNPKKPVSIKENLISHKRKTDFRSNSSPVNQILFLQRTIGNQAVSRLIRSGALQAKLRIGQPGDKYEQEADRVADEVMLMPEPQTVSRENSHIQRVCEGCEEEELRRQPIKEEEKEKLRRQHQTMGVAALNALGVSPLLCPTNTTTSPSASSATISTPESVPSTSTVGPTMTRSPILPVQFSSLNSDTVTQSNRIYRTSLHKISKTAKVPQVIQRLGNPITEADLPSPTARDISSSEQTLRRFMREVYRRQVLLWTARNATYLHEVPPSELVTLSSSYAIPNKTIVVHKGIQHPVTNMIDDARAALRRAIILGGTAVGIRNVGIRSGYRSAASQFEIWMHWAPVYYRRTLTNRRDIQRFPGGEHSDTAAQYLAEYTNQRVFSAGYSPHQQGKTVDVSYEEKSGWAPADTSPEWISKWQSSWFFGWLKHNAFRYGFFQNPNINEPWHWEFSPPVASILRIIQWILELLEPLIGQRRLWYGDERTRETEPPQERSPITEGE